MPSGTTKVDHYIAFRTRERSADSDAAWDMMRYDRCYPASNTPSGWLVFLQPHLDGVKGGFTVARWESFGFRNPILGSTTTRSGIPTSMHMEMEKADQYRQEGIKKTSDQILDVLKKDPDGIYSVGVLARMREIEGTGGRIQLALADLLKEDKIKFSENSDGLKFWSIK